MSQPYHSDTGTQPTPVVKPPQPQWNSPPYPPPPETYYSPLSPIPPTQPSPLRKRMAPSTKIALSFLAVLLLVAGSFVVGILANGNATAQSNQDATATAQAVNIYVTNVAAAETATANDQATQAASIPSPIVTTADTPTPQPSPTPSFVTFGDGTYQVGTDIPPGTYRTQTASQGCYYERLKGFSGTDSDILANNLTDFPAIVTILPTDKGFSSQNCGTWTSDLSQITTSKTTFGDGMYIVGTDIEPGTYRNTASQGCYYARLSGFSNSDNDIIANNLTDNSAIVTISATDKGFESKNCGTWTKI